MRCGVPRTIGLEPWYLARAIESGGSPEPEQDPAEARVAGHVPHIDTALPRRLPPLSTCLIRRKIAGAAW